VTEVRNAVRSASPTEARGQTLELVAFPLRGSQATLVPAAHERAWMSDEMERRPYRCLPLSIANSSGWMLLNEQPFAATWNGGRSVGSTKLVFAGRRDGGYHATTVFGHGIVTWLVPFLFRTPPGYNLLVRGPANMPKDGASPLEGIVETDWAVATFTMNWQLTRANTPVVFGKDEPVCMIVPQRRGELARFRPQMRSLEDEPRLDVNHGVWQTSRSMFVRDLRRRRCLPAETGPTWQRHYFQGVTPVGDRSPEHETKVRLCPFEELPHLDDRP
jgi:Family of unknown function (DUF6065)